ncbi:MAG TPA: hypothetical protein VH392_04690 [Sphingomicrobium sp.]|jgi:hypothetical protein
MPRYRIRLINSEFESVGETDYPSLDAARKAAIATATKVVAESSAEEAPSVAVEVQIHEGETLVARHVVSLSVSDLSGGKRPSG